MVRSALPPALGRGFIALAVVALLLPAAAGAQVPLPGEPLRAGRLRIAPFVGWAPGITRQETWDYISAGGQPFRDQAETFLAAGQAVGVAIDATIISPVSLHAGVTWADRAETQVSVNGGSRLLLSRDRSLLLKAGIAVELRPARDMTIRRIEARVFAAPFYVIQEAERVPRIQHPPLYEPAHHAGLNLGATADFPFAADRLALQLGFEDYFTFWNDRDVQRVADWYRAVSPDDPSATIVAPGRSHQWLLRAGLSLRLF